MISYEYKLLLITNAKEDQNVPCLEEKCWLAFFLAKILIFNNQLHSIKQRPLQCGERMPCMIQELSFQLEKCIT